MCDRERPWRRAWVQLAALMVGVVGIGGVMLFKLLSPVTCY